VSLVNVFVIRLSGAPPDEEHNYGHARVDGLGAMFEGGFIFAAGAFIIYEAVHKIRIGEETHSSVVGIAVMIPILAMTLGTVWYLRKVARDTGSLVVKSDALHYLTDVWVNVGVLVSLALVHLTHVPVIDPIISILIALYMLSSSTHIVRDGFQLVMDKSLDAELVGRVQEVLRATPDVESFHDLKTRAGKVPHVDFHIVVRPELSTKRVHDLFLDVQERIRAVVGPSTKVLMHADPLGG
jgi:cation diffusion facilitator family transporter